MKTTAAPTHPFIWDGVEPDYFGNRWCTCRRVERNPLHRVPERSPEEIATEARILGEHEEEDRE